MARNGTQADDRGTPSRALVACAPIPVQGPAHRARPASTFLVQLALGPQARLSRPTRTREAARLYAEAATLNALASAGPSRPAGQA